MPPAPAPSRPAPWTAPTPAPDALATPRLVLRLYREGDEHALFEAVNHSRPTLVPWLPWGKAAHHTLHDTIHDMVKFRNQARALGPGVALVLGVFRRDTGALVGGTGFHTIVPDLAQAEVGYWMDARHRRQGLCAEATRWLISWMFTAQDATLTGADGAPVRGWGFRRAEILCAGGNAPSAGVPGSLGLRLEQRRTLDRWVEDRGWDDTLCWGVLREEWDAAKHAMAHPPTPDAQA